MMCKLCVLRPKTTEYHKSKNLTEGDDIRTNSVLKMKTVIRFVENLGKSVQVRT